MLCHETDVQRFCDGSERPTRGLHCEVQVGAAEAGESYICPQYSWYMALKAILDFSAAALLLVVALPVMLLAALAIKLTSRGPAFYQQVRVGKDGRSFTLYKLRTMVDKAEALTGPVWSSASDARVTPLGRILRKTHIDEFPQLFNVLRGEMSLVGPRPERPEFVAKLEWEIPCYRDRLNVRPGITGLAQVRLPPDTDLESVRRKIVHDVYYVRNVSPWLDLQLLVVTGWTLSVELVRFGWERVALPSSDRVEQGFLQAASTSSLPEHFGESVTLSSPK